MEWDCESIVSTYSNIYNHPKQIADSRKQINVVINKATGMPEIEGAEKADDASKRRGLPAGLTSQAEDHGDSGGSEEDASVCPSTRLFELGARQKNESAEDKKARKEAAKELKALAREKKSAKKALLKMEKSGPAISAADPRTKGGLSIQRF